MDYPELYYTTYPKVISEVNLYLEGKSEIEEITPEDIDGMLDNIYVQLANEYPEIHQDIQERKIRSRRYTSQSRAFYGRSKIIRDLISILLISELLRRNRIFYPI